MKIEDLFKRYLEEDEYDDEYDDEEDDDLGNGEDDDDEDEGDSVDDNDIDDDDQDDQNDKNDNRKDNKKDDKDRNDKNKNENQQGEEQKVKDNVDNNVDNKNIDEKVQEVKEKEGDGSKGHTTSEGENAGNNPKSPAEPGQEGGATGSGEKAAEGGAKTGEKAAEGGAKTGEKAAEGGAKVGEKAAEEGVKTGGKTVGETAAVGETATTATTAGGTAATTASGTAATTAAGGTATTAAGGSAAGGGLASAFAATLPWSLIVLIIIIIIIIIILIVSFFQTLPGVVFENLKKTVKQWFVDVIGNTAEAFGLENQHIRIPQHRVQELAQYITDMGYDIQTYGFGDIKVGTTTAKSSQGENLEDENIDVVNTKPNRVDKVEVNDDGKTEKDQIKSKYLKAYLAADECTYHFRKTNWLKDLLGYEAQQGLINPLTTGDLLFNTDEDKLEIDREGETLKVYNKSLDIPVVSFFKEIFTGTRAFQWGSIISYDINTWIGRYKRPVELFLALHLATMMPDIPYQIATKNEFNTQVDIAFEPVKIYLKGRIDAKKGQYGEPLQDTYAYIKTNGEKHYVRDIIADYFELFEPGHWTRDVFGIESSYKALWKNYITQVRNGIIPKENVWNIFKQMYSRFNDKNLLEKLWDLVFEATASVRIVTVGSDDKEQVTNFSVKQTHKIDPKEGRDEKRKKIVSFAYLVYKFSTEDIKDTDLNDMLWPFVTDVKNHWYYKDIDFLGSDAEPDKATYRLARKGYKTIFYSNDNHETFEMPCALYPDKDSDWNYLVYQVAEPKVEAPNENIKKVFRGQYYCYDGTHETAQAIANSRALEEILGFSGKTSEELEEYLNDEENEGEIKNKIKDKKYYYNGDKYDVEKEKWVKKEQLELKDPATTLQALAIVENMHSVASDYIYRDLKDLFVKLDFYSKEDMTEDLKLMMMWPIYCDNKNATFTLAETHNSFGRAIVGVGGRTVLAPMDGQLKISTDATGGRGRGYVIEVGELNSDHAKLLEWIFKNDYYKINKEALKGLKIHIAGFELDEDLEKLLVANRDEEKGIRVRRGSPIGTVIGDSEKGKLEITILKEDNTVVEDLAEYMRQDHNNKYEAIMEKRMNNEGTKEAIPLRKGVRDGFDSVSNSTYNAETYADTLVWPVPDAPTEWITSRYGWRGNPTSEEGEPQFHRGLDIGANAGVPIISVSNGVVCANGWNEWRGWYIAIYDEATQRKYVYQHMQKQSTLLIRTQVSASKTIGYVGSTGDSTGNHLHFEIHPNSSNSESISTDKDDTVDPSRFYYIRANAT